MIGVVLAAVLAVTAVGCTAADDTADESATEQEESADGGAGTLDPADAAISTEVSLPGVEGTIAVDLFPLEVEGKVQTLNVLFTPDFAGLGEDETIQLYDMLGNRPFAPQLVDKTNLKTYSVITARDNQAIAWTTDAVDTSVVNGESVAVWAVFAAPEDSVDSLDVKLHDDWPVFEDIPVIE